MAKPQRLKERNQGRTSGQELIEKEKEFSEHFQKTILIILLYISVKVLKVLFIYC